VILYQNGYYCINPQLEIITDVEKFTYYWKKGRAVEASQGLHQALHAYNKAIGFYREEFLEDLQTDDWCDSERANLREIYLFILNRLSTYFLEEKNYYACINVCKKILATDDCLEEAHRKMMRCYCSLGLLDMAFKQFFKCKKVLAGELELQPSQLTVSLFEEIQSGAVV
jgi:DNA-binding SARP family transcriptional activator